MNRNVSIFWHISLLFFDFFYFLIFYFFYFFTFVFVLSFFSICDFGMALFNFAVTCRKYVQKKFKKELSAACPLQNLYLLPAINIFFGKYWEVLLKKMICVLPFEGIYLV